VDEPRIVLKLIAYKITLNGIYISRLTNAFGSALSIYSTVSGEFVVLIKLFCLF
jgi:hypothetical protein